MIPKSKIRQAALNAVYAVLTNGGDAQSMDWDLFWSICEEKETDRYRLALCKALDHVCRQNVDTSRLLDERAGAVSLAMDGDLTTAPLRDKLVRYTDSSKKFDAALAAMRYSVKDKRRDTTAQLDLCSKDVMGLAAITVELGEMLLPMFADFPAYSSLLTPLAATVNRRAKHLTLCAKFQDIATMQVSEEYAGLARQAKDLMELRPAAQELASAVLSHREGLDALMAPLLQNYSTERLDVLDKSILYISLYELKYNKLEVAIVVSEATALANEYSGGKSAPFIHGVIAAAAAQN